MVKKKTGQKKQKRRTTTLMLVGHFSQQSRRLSQGDAKVGGTSCALNAPCSAWDFSYDDLRHGSFFFALVPSVSPGSTNQIAPERMGVRPALRPCPRYTQRVNFRRRAQQPHRAPRRQAYSRFRATITQLNDPAAPRQTALCAGALPAPSRPTPPPT